MIRIIDKECCCGCSACLQICPKQCITLYEDIQGFNYPQVNTEDCIDCHLCEKVCPCLNQSNSQYPLKIYAAINPNEEVRMISSSGGIFTMLAEKIIDEGGVVFGARFDDNWLVKHDFVESKEDLHLFRGSKYVQSSIGDTYIQVRNFLMDGRFVLFSGTGCQVSGLKRFLLKDYANLITVDIVCHGVPSPKVWSSYLEHVNPLNKRITYINMRDKSRGWSRYSYVINSNEETIYNDYAENSEYLRGFSSNLYLRPSCYSCPAKGGKANSDITLADCWGYENMCKDMYDDKGLSAIVCHSTKGEDFLNKIRIYSKEIDYALFTKGNPSYITSSELHRYYGLFWKLFPQIGISAVSVVQKKMKPCIIRRILSHIKHIIIK